MIMCETIEEGEEQGGAFTLWARGAPGAVMGCRRGTSTGTPPTSQPPLSPSPALPCLHCRIRGDRGRGPGSSGLSVKSPSQNVLMLDGEAMGTWGAMLAVQGGGKQGTPRVGVSCGVSS